MSQSRRLLLDATFDHLRTPLFRYIHAPHPRERPALTDVHRRHAKILQSQHLDRLSGCLFNSAQRRITRRVDTELDGEYRRTFDLHFVQYPALELAPENSGVGARRISEARHYGSVRPIQQRGGCDASRCKRVIRRLHAREQHVGRLTSRDGRNEPRNGNRVGTLDGVVPHAYSPVRAFRQALAECFVGIVRSDTDRHDFDRSRRRLLDLHRLLEREIIPFIQVANEKIGLHVLTVGADFEVLVQRGHLLDGYEDFHAVGLILTAVSTWLCGSASRTSSMSSFTTNLPSLPVVLSASSNMVRSFGQLTT